MDLEFEGWVNVTYDGLLEILDDGVAHSFSRKYVKSPKNLFKMDYFNSSRKSQEFTNSSSKEESRFQNRLIPLQIQMDDHQVVDDYEEEVKEIPKLLVSIKTELKEAPEGYLIDPIFKVFFKKENEFFRDSPRSNSQKLVSPYNETDMFQYKNESDDYKFDDSSPSKVVIDDIEKATKEEGNIWKWGSNGIDAFFSLGMTAATICVILFGNGQRHNQQKFRMQIYLDDKGKRSI
ncbi:hypothetical protein L2E82_34698 [Cichorium intybus]|uniref:Uncharacterized protein n=1 Tax=Cichorium intybus TaxID=13427 RepID=A0ACB9BMK5_CICIN|nr:hypothetical protein L2E82_34698 [Cichorium intybus]